MRALKNPISAAFPALLLLLFFSCATGGGRVAERDVDSLDSLRGTWICDDGASVSFPVTIDGEEYMLVSERYEDISAVVAENVGFEGEKTLDSAWQRRFSIFSGCPKVRGDGCEFSYRFKRDEGAAGGPLAGGRLLASGTFLIPSSVLSENLELFAFRQDGGDVSLLRREGFREFFAGFSDSNVSGRGIALVLSGGGGKGAYEVGVWKALSEFGLSEKVTAFSGTSVGALNAALFASVDAGEAERIWREEVPVEIRSDDEIISRRGLEKIIGTVDIARLTECVYPKVFATAVRNRAMLLKFFVSAPGSFSHRFLLNSESPAEAEKILLASSAIPLLMDPVELEDGFDYSDGGQEFVGGDNTPLEPVLPLSHCVERVVVVYLNSGVGEKSRRRAGDFAILEIVPSRDLGDFFSGTANFSPEKISMLIELGHGDAARALSERGLAPVKRFWFEE